MIQKLLISFTFLSAMALQAQHSIDIKAPLTLLPIVEELGDKKVVGLGEGTHGTKEFNEVRIELIKQLADKGFNKIMFETAYGDMYNLNQAINSTDDIQVAMKTNLLSIWQTKEVEELLLWIREYNKTASPKIELSGFDVNFISNAAAILKQSNLYNSFPRLIDDIVHTSIDQDSFWEKSNDSSYELDYNKLIESGLRGFSYTKELEELITQNNTTIKTAERLALNNLKYAYSLLEAVSKRNENYTRDQIMAQMVLDLLESDGSNKIILWAHVAHLSLKPLAIDPMGMYLKENLGDKYAVLATIPAKGSVSLINENIDTRTNVHFSKPIHPMPSDSWNSIFSQMEDPSFFVDLHNQNLQEIFKSKYKLRILGYGDVDEKTLNKYYTFKDIKLNEYFDSIIFIRDTQAAEHIN